MNSSMIESHYLLHVMSSSYKEFFFEQVHHFGWEPFVIKDFAKWLLVGTKIERFSTWTKEQFENQFRFWNND